MTQPFDPDLAMEGSRTAIIRAARRAAQIAKQHNQPLLLWRDGKIARIMPDDLPPLPDKAPIKNETGAKK